MRMKEESVIDCRLNRDSFVPLYQQIKLWLRYKIEAGELREGESVPSEAVLTRSLEVSRAVVRQAFYELRLEGYVVRDKGRGTFVRTPPGGSANGLPRSA